MVDQIRGVVSLAYGTTEIQCEDPRCDERCYSSDQRTHAPHPVDVPAVFLGRSVIWRGTKDMYWDDYGDGGAALEDIVAERLRVLFEMAQ